MKIKGIFLSVFITVIIFSCNKDEGVYEPINQNEYVEGEELPIGTFSVFLANNDAFGAKIPGLDRTGDINFAVGDRLFITTWVPAPASTTGLDGLGPTFNAKSCANCHFKDGRGKPLNESTTETSRGFLMRISLPGEGEHGSPKPVPGYNTQLQNKGVLRVPAEGQVKLTFETINGTYPDGTTYELRKPIYTFFDENFGSLQNVLFSPRVAPQTIGLGFVDGLPESEILKNADEFDADKDGISGRPNYVWNIEKQTKTIGLYGWKANTPTLKQQVANAFHDDMGLTNSLFTENDCPSPQQDCFDSPHGGTPEVTDLQLERITFYQATLAVPVRRNYKEQNVLDGKALFSKLNCITCHATNLKVKSSNIVPMIANTVINPYSDFLLHDMGEDLSDNRPDFLATGKEWRTQPLWGIGLIKTINKHTFLLHDGRARNVEEAILWHGGEAEKSKQDFMNLTKKERNQVLQFINSL